MEERIYLGSSDTFSIGFDPDGEVCGYPGNTDVIPLRVRSVPRARREEGESLYEPHSEQHHLVPGQSLSHALSLPYSEGDQGRVPLIPEIIITITIMIKTITIITRDLLPPVLANKSLRIELLRILEVCAVSHDELQIEVEPRPRGEGVVLHLDGGQGLVAHSERQDGSQAVCL